MKKRSIEQMRIIELGYILKSIQWIAMLINEPSDVSDVLYELETNLIQKFLIKLKVKMKMDPLNQKQYKQLCDFCDKILKNLKYKNIIIQWLHIINIIQFSSTNIDNIQKTKLTKSYELLFKVFFRYSKSF